MHMNFIENPLNRGPYDKGVGCALAGVHLDSVYIEVSIETFITKQFQSWLVESVYLKCVPGKCDAIRVAIMTNRGN